MGVEESLIFSSVRDWINANTNSNTEDRNLLLSRVRLHLLPKNDLLNSVRETKLFSSDALLDAIKIQEEKRVNDHRIFNEIDVNIATPNYGAKVISGKVNEGDLKTNLLSGINNCCSNKHTYHGRHNEQGIVIELEKMS